MLVYSEKTIKQQSLALVIVTCASPLLNISCIENPVAADEGQVIVFVDIGGTDVEDRGQAGFVEVQDVLLHFPDKEVAAREINVGAKELPYAVLPLGDAYNRLLPEQSGLSWRRIAFFIAATSTHASIP